MIKVTNNIWATIKLDDKMLEIVSIIYSLNKYKIVKWAYSEAEDYIIERWLCLWDLFWWILIPIKNLNILPELLSQWQEDKDWDIILNKLFWKHEKK